MGRTMKRVPLDFSWPLHEIWRGYINPHHKPCPEHEKTCWNGDTAAGHWLDAIVHLIALLGEEAAAAPHAAALAARGRIYPHPYLEEWGTAPREPIPDSVTEQIRSIKDKSARFRSLRGYLDRHPPKLMPLTPEILALVEGLAGEKLAAGFFGNSGSMAYEIRGGLLRAAKMPKDWGVCPVCRGGGIDPKAKDAYDAWKPEEPPAGDGFQLWETTSEGSPISPVFATLDDLCAWAADGATTFGSSKASAEEWKRMLGKGLVCHRDGNVVFI